MTSVGGSILIEENDALTSLTGLQGVNSIGENLRITGNDELPNLLGLENVTILEADLFIMSNSSLTSLAGMENLNAEIMDDLRIYDNPLLTECEILSVCDYLNHSFETAEISGNSAGCNSPEEVQDSCEIHFSCDDIGFGDYVISIFPNPANQVLKITVEGFTIDEVVIYTLAGQQVFAIKSQGESIDISHLQSGMYIVEVTVEGKKMRQKLLVE